MEKFFPPKAKGVIQMGESPSFQNQLPFVTNVQNTSAKVVRPLLLGNTFYNKANDYFPRSRLGGSKITYDTRYGVKRVYLSSENRNQKGIILTYE